MEKAQQLAKIRALIDSLCDEEVLILISELKESFCLECGTPQSRGHMCSDCLTQILRMYGTEEE